MKIAFATSIEEIQACFAVMSELRPHLKQAEFCDAIAHLMEQYDYRLVYVTDPMVKAVAGIRVAHWLHSGKYLEIEDLVTDPACRSQGYGDALFDWIVDYAREQHCQQVRLVSGVQREAAHRFYERKGMQVEAKYFSLTLSE